MNSDSESLQNQLLKMLLADDAGTDEDTSVECKEINGVENLTTDETDSKSSKSRLDLIPQSFLLGEIPTVQERFQAILKRRLQIQIQDHPPLFPWETQLKDYPDYLDNPAVNLVPAWVWVAQQSKLNLPISLPDRVFQQLLERCQALIASSIPLGAKLVQAVESLFPGDPQGLNDLAGLVLRSPYRSVAGLDVIPDLDSSYSELQTRQQMALSLLAAKQLLDNLTLPVSVSEPVIERQWLSSAGTLNLKVEYQPSANGTAKLRVQGDLPVPGILTIQGNNSHATAQSANPGSLNVEINCNQLNQTYILEVDFQDTEQQPLRLMITPTA
jgi:hypothetical protein